MAEPAEIEAYLKLNSAHRVGPVHLNLLLQAFGSPEKVLSASVKELGQVERITRGVAEAIHTAAATDVRPEIELAEDLGVRMIPLSDARYPRNLRYIYDPPILLYVKGEVVPQDVLAIAIVGTRRATHYGISRAEQLSTALAGGGFCIVSGMARGIDAAAHRGALRAHGRTIAVLGCGLSRIYPPEHDELAETISRNGAVLSELPLLTPPDRGNFPARNRLISGLSLGVVVVEAAKESGSLITARWAGEQGREVFAVPGPVDSPRARGVHALIRDGAVLVESPEDILGALGPLAEEITIDEDKKVTDPRVLGLNDREAKVYKLLCETPLSPDDITAATGLPPGTIASVLTVLQMRGLAHELPGKQFVKK